MIEAVPFEQGDLRWVFPDVPDDLPVGEALLRISAKIERLAESFGVRAGETGRGLEYVKVSGIPLAGVFGRVEISGITFRADLYFERHSARDQRWGPPWTVSCDIEVRGPDDPSIVIEELSEVVDTEKAAVRIFEAQVDWLIARGTAEELDYWRAQADERPPSL
jgi:hypothetical protein